MHAEWKIDAPPPPLHAIPGKTHSLKIEETILFKPDSMPMHLIERSGDGYKVIVSVHGTDINKPALFQARYRVYWTPLS
jgi:hypothetical protein